MYCRKCGNEIMEGANICGYCGTPVHSGQEVNGQNANPGADRQNIYGEAAPSYSGQAPGGGNQYNYSSYNGYPSGQQGGAPAPMDGGAVGMAIASLVLGIVAILLVCCVSIWWLTALCAAASIVFGALALGKHTGGRGMAIAGIVCSIVSLVLEIILLIVGIGLFAAIMSEFV